MRWIIQLETRDNAALVYADEILLIADSADKLQEAVKECDEILRNKGMLINVKKSKIIQVDRAEEEIESIYSTCNGK